MLSRLSSRWNRASSSRLALLLAFTASAWSALYSTLYVIREFASAPVRLDFRIFYAAASIAAHQGFSRIYDLDALRAASAAFPLPEQVINSHATYINPPLLAFLLLPFTALSEPRAYVSFTLVSLLALLVAWRLAAPFHGLGRIALLLLALGSFPLMLSLVYGQPVLLMLGLAAFAFSRLQSRHLVQAALALALACFLKPQGLFLLPLVLLASHRFRPFLAFALIAALLASISAFLLTPQGLHSYALALAYVQSDPIHSLYTLSYLLVSPFNYLAMALCAALALLVAHVRRRQLEIVFAVGLLGSLLASPHLHQADYSLLFLAIWLVLRSPLSRAHALYLLLAYPALQLLTLGFPQVILAWEFIWLLVLLAPAWPFLRPSLPRSLTWLAHPLVSSWAH